MFYRWIVLLYRKIIILYRSIVISTQSIDWSRCGGEDLGLLWWQHKLNMLMVVFQLCSLLYVLTPYTLPSIDCTLCANFFVHSHVVHNSRFEPWILFWLVKCVTLVRDCRDTALTCNTDIRLGIGQIWVDLKSKNLI